MLGKFLSTRLLAVVATVGVAVLPNFVEKMTEAIAWPLYVVVGLYIVGKTAEDITRAVLDYKKSNVVKEES